jgi:hypothetical protein
VELRLAGDEHERGHGHVARKKNKHRDEGEESQGRERELGPPYPLQSWASRGRELARRGRAASDAGTVATERLKMTALAGNPLLFPFSVSN